MISDAEEILGFINDLENGQPGPTPKQTQLYDAVRSLCMRIKDGDRGGQMTPERPL